ncbi:hypothetical protein GUJ93_ZPchr0003g16735 [Zizania palustris]|uniref:Uncharacterized protein n=1 Tax=Zizania palustris TaxID=103762 RepID=A0A8J5RK94_ZIZPA|nr:hypothetical protein GUJ93_ZPchr0003g16735 [Zizania palustris]
MATVDAVPEDDPTDSRSAKDAEVATESVDMPRVITTSLDASAIADVVAVGVDIARATPEGAEATGNNALDGAITAPESLATGADAAR